MNITSSSYSNNTVESFTEKLKSMQSQQILNQTSDKVKVLKNLARELETKKQSNNQKEKETDEILAEEMKNSKQSLIEFLGNADQVQIEFERQSASLKKLVSDYKNMVENKVNIDVLV
ncbi:MAG: hypothetical protein WC337_06520 [Candidatus Muiribacteriota bacterium]